MSWVGNITAYNIVSGSLFSLILTGSRLSGTYPACELCGECYDSWAGKIDNIGTGLKELYAGVMLVWSNYGNHLTLGLKLPIDDQDIQL